MGSYKQLAIVSLLAVLVVFPFIGFSQQAPGPSSVIISINGIVYNSTFSAAGAVNVSVYNITFSSNGPPTEVLFNSTLTNSTGHFSLGFGNVSQQSMFTLKILHNDSTGYADQIGPAAQPMPGFVYQFMQSNTSFYMQPAATLNLTAYGNLTNGSSTNNVSFNYMIFDQAFGFPIVTSMGASGLVNSSLVAVPRDRNYSVVFMRDPNAVGFGPDATPPMSYSVTTLSNLSANNISNSYGITIRQNLSYSLFNITGPVIVTGNTSPVRITTISTKLVPIPGMLPPNTGISIGNTNYTNNLSYHVNAMGSGSGISYVVEVYANSSSEYFGAYQNFTITGNTSYNITLYRLLGTYDGTSATVNTSKITFTLYGRNSTSSSVVNTANVNLVMTHSSYGSLTYIIDTLTNGSFSIPILNQTNLSIQVFSNSYAPKQLVYKLFANNSNQNLTVNQFRPERILANGSKEAVSGMIMRVMKYSDACNIPNLNVTACKIGGDNDEGFNPMMMMNGAKQNIRIELSNGTGPIMYLINVDMIRSGPPDGEMSDNALSSVNESSSFQQVWKFGNAAPRVYERAIVGMPYNDSVVNESLTIRVKIPTLYDDDWNLVWNTSVNGTNPGASLSDYNDYNVSLFEGAVCSKIDNNATCFQDTANNRIWIRVPHFTGVSPTVDGGVLNVTQVTPLNNTFTNVTSQTFVCNATDTATLVNMTRYVFNSTGIENQSDNTTIGGFSNQTIFPYTFGANATYNWTCLAYNSQGNGSYAARNWTITIDTVTPGIVIGSPANHSSAVLSVINITVSDANINFTNVSIINSTGGIANSTTSTTNGTQNISIGLVIDGVYNVTATTWDKAGNSNTTSRGNITFDVTAPNITFISPSDSSNTSISRNYTFINVTLNDSYSNISTCILQLTNTTNNAINYTMTMSANGTNIYCYYNSTNMTTEGNYSYKVFANDSLGNMNNSLPVSIIVDLTAPSVSSYSPNTATATTATITLATNENATCRYTTTSGTAYSGMGGSYVGNGTSHTLALTGLTTGSYTYYTRCNDTAGNVMTTDHSVILTVTIGTSSTAGGGGSASSTASYAFDKIVSGATATVNNNVKDSGISTLEITTNAEATSVSISIQKLTINPVSATVNANAYKYISVNHNILESKFASVNIKVDVEKTWIDNNSIDESKIYLERYETSAWKKYSTIKIGDNGTHITYQATVPGLSYFAISGDKVITECTSGKRCDGKQLQECVNKLWVTTQTCADGCDSTSLNCTGGVVISNETTGPECTTGSKQCVGNDLQLCVAEQWTKSATCELGCNAEKLECNTPIETPTTTEIPWSAIIIVAIIAVCAIAYFLFFRKSRASSKTVRVRSG